MASAGGSPDRSVLSAGGSPGRSVLPAARAIGREGRRRSPSIVPVDRVWEIVRQAGAPGDPALALLAARQHNLVTRAQAVAAGLGPDAVDHRLRRGRLHPVHPGVFCLGSALLMPGASALAAVLACGAGARAGHETAAALLGLLPDEGRELHVTLPNGDRRPRGVRVHRADIPAEDRWLADGIPICGPALVLLQLAAGGASVPVLEKAFDEAAARRLVDETTLAERARGRRGAQALRRVLARRRGPSFTRSEAERRALRIIAEAGLPRPAVNAPLGGYEVDLLWRPEKVVLEIDGYAFHRGRGAFERDRRKTARLQALGYTVLRVTWRWLADDVPLFVATLAAALARGTLSSEARLAGR